MQEAISKVKAEMDKEKQHPYIQVVGEFLLSHITNNPNDAEKILAQDKTIMKSLDAMKKVAEKSKVRNVAVLTPQQGFEVVLKYFGITASPDIPVISAGSIITTAKQSNVSSDFDVSLDDFL